MPITHTVDRDRRRITFDVAGTLRIDEMLAAVDSALESAGAGTYTVLSDHRQLLTAATTTQLHTLIAHLATHRAHLGDSRWGVVVAQPASFGMMRMLSVLAEEIPIEVGVFKDLTAASEWLDLPPGAAHLEPPP